MAFRFLIILLFCFSALCFAQNQKYQVANPKSGIYKTYEDFQNGELKHEFEKGNEDFEIWPLGFFQHRDVEITTSEATIVYNREKIWGYTDHKGRLIRIDRRKHFEVLSDNGIVIYRIYSPVRTAFYFSETLNDPIYKLRRGRLKSVYKDDNDDFIQKLKQSKKEEWTIWLENHDKFLIQKLISD